MNIFYIDKDPMLCAQWAVDKHVVKMILESAQLLSTAHRVLDGSETTIRAQYKGSNPPRFYNKKWWTVSDERESKLYKATHVNHPCAIWARESTGNYNWLWLYLYEHCCEYTHRYGKIHKVSGEWLLSNLAASPNNIPNGPFTEPPQAMPDEYKHLDTIQAYRNYYKYGKAHLHKWKNRQPPDWIKE